jgi:hypothetical protein
MALGIFKMDGLLRGSLVARRKPAELWVTNSMQS